MRRVKGLSEAAAPHQALPVGCGAFLCDSEAFAALKAWVIPDLVSRASVDSPARVWVPSCATGEEAYSIAMLLLEQFEVSGRQPDIQVFATDTDADVIKMARAGIYPCPRVSNLSEAQLGLFFTRHRDDQYRVSAALRNCVVFATHDLILDPPISRVDLVSCRNLLPHLAPGSRASIIARLHFALNEGGYLLLGPGESIDRAADLFAPVAEERHLFRHIGPGRRPLSNRWLAARGDDRASRARRSFERSGEALRAAREVESRDSEFEWVSEQLATSKEELQSVNGELTTVNNQLEANLAELDAEHNDLINLMTATNIAILFLDSELRIKRFTAPTATLLNLRERDIGRPCGDLAAQFDAGLLSDARLVVLTRTAVERNVRAAHNKCYLRRIHPYRVGGKSVGGVVVTFVEITSQIEADAQLRRFAAVLRDSEDAILVTGFDGRIKAWNRGAERLYGYTEAEALKLNMSDLAAGRRFECTLDIMRRVAGGEVVPSFDTRRRTRDGRTLDVSATVALLLDAAGNPDCLATTERDITARRRAEEETRQLNARLEQRVAERTTELQHSEERIRAILDATADAVLTIDMLGNIATFNRAAERIFGYSASEVIGRNVTILIPPHERVGRYGYKATVSRTFASRFYGRSHEISGRRKDGTQIPIQLSVNSVEGRGLYVGVARDMTEHKALQKEIIEVAMREQRRIGQELHDGTQQELTGLGLLAQSLAEALSLGGATAAGQVAARVARGIEQSNQRVRSLARGMVPVPIYREGLMTTLAELARQTTEIHGLPCGFECPAPVEIDNDNEATHLYRIAQEAVSNATRHAKASAIWIRLEQVDGRLLLEVQDNGIGLQAPGGPGTGVGLRLMEHRCALIGGTFAIDLRIDGGTSIVCAVPRPKHA